MNRRKDSQKIQEISFNNIALRMSEHDNVAIAKNDIQKNTVIKINGTMVKVGQAITKGHRFSLMDVKKGEFVFQYGYAFGLSRGIKRGQVIDSCNTEIYKSNDSEALISIAGAATYYLQNQRRRHYKQCGNTFWGYKRRDGRVGTRNYYLVVPTSLCAGDSAFKIAYAMDNSETLRKKYKNVDGIVAAVHTEGCGCNDGEIIDRVMRTLKNTIDHPNVGGALVVDLGCEKTNYKVVSEYFHELSACKKPIDYLSIQKAGGTRNTLETGKNIILARLKEVNTTEREEVSLKYLVAGTECGASDSFSGITANPLIGLTVDKIIYGGGSAILSETPEMIGAESSLMKRMVSEHVARKFIKGMNYYKTLAERLNVAMDGNFVPGNKEGGLVNLTLKSLGAILKGGSTEIVDFVDYAERVKKQGLSIMNGPGNDLESMTGIVASGANIILFSTGMGTTEGNAITPVIKLSSRTEIFQRMHEDIDFNAGVLLDNNISLDQLSEQLLTLVIEVASGKKSRSEIWEKRSFQIWTAGKLSL
ncbi:MAG: hypothetical protein CV087_11690 [Candidatus Brocadia sp. WS118]|nr:MAG: hypothetical protein CV087_11690 [Candidatus Brocadia sp. WS118]